MHEHKIVNYIYLREWIDYVFHIQQGCQQNLVKEMEWS
jgi:hypothetical protein